MLAKGVNANDQGDVTAHLTQESADVSGSGREVAGSWGLDPCPLMHVLLPGGASRLPGWAMAR